MRILFVIEPFDVDRLQGLSENVALARKHYPDPVIEVLFPADYVPTYVDEHLKSLNVSLWAKSPGNLFHHWLLAFTKIGEPGGEPVLFRSPLARITAREAAAVRQWLQSVYPFHVIRDAEQEHNIPIVPHLFGARCGAIRSLDRMVSSWIEGVLPKSPCDAYQLAERFLAEALWPRIRQYGVLRHDPFQRSWDFMSVPWPEYRPDDSDRGCCGQIFLREEVIEDAPETRQEQGDAVSEHRGAGEIRQAAEAGSGDCLLSQAKEREKTEVNPDWKALEGRPHGTLLINPGSYKTVEVGPQPNQDHGKENSKEEQSA